MPTQSSGDQSPHGGALPALASDLHYLLKYAHLRLRDLTSSALEPFGISGRECAVLIAIDDPARFRSKKPHTDSE